MIDRAIESLPMTGAYFRLILRRFGSTPELAGEIVAGTRIDPEAAMAAGPDEMIELGQMLQQVANIVGLVRSGRIDASWGLELGRSLDGPAHGTLGVATTTAPRLIDALSVLERFAHLRAPYFRLESDIEGSVFSLRIEPQLRLEPSFWRPMVEALVSSFQAVVEAALGRPMSEGHFEFDFPAPAYADLYAELLHAPVSFGAPSCAIALPKAWLPLPCPFADPALHQSALERVEADERRFNGETFIVAQVERVLEGAGDAGIGMDEVAEQLGMSRRTLVRRLGQRDASFRELAEEHRKRRARELLAESELTVTEIADRLGYTEAANFGRACRRWFGASPRQYRTRLKSLPDSG